MPVNYIMLWYFTFWLAISKQVNKPGSTSQKHRATLAPKTTRADSTLEMAPPPIFLDPVSQSGLTHILYYLRMFQNVNKVSYKPDHDSSLLLAIILFIWHFRFSLIVCTLKEFASQHFIMSYEFSKYAGVVHDTTLERLSSYKHSSLLGPFLTYEKNEVLWIWPQGPYSQHSIFFIT